MLDFLRDSYISADESGFYYLQSRYYDPAVGRFLNADIFVATGQSFSGNNMFAYCGNNPNNRTDSNGCFYTVAGVEDQNDFLKTLYEYIGSGSCGGATSTLSSMAVTGVLLSAALSIAIAEKKEIKAHEQAVTIADTVAVQPPNDAIYFGVDMRGGSWKIVTNGMDFNTAVTWVLTNATVGSYGRRSRWGLYTIAQKDAMMMAIELGGPGPCLHEKRFGEYPHFHPSGMLLFGQYKHFHIWYGSVYGG